MNPGWPEIPSRLHEDSVSVNQTTIRKYHNKVLENTRERERGLQHSNSQHSIFRKTEIAPKFGKKQF